MTQDTATYDLTPLLRKHQTLLEYQSVKLPTGKEILTLLWSRPGESWPAISRDNIAEHIAQWTTDIWDLSPDGTARLWGPGVEYSKGAIFACEEDDVLYGWDMPHPEVIYACTCDGAHLDKIILPLRLETPLAPKMTADGAMAMLTGDKQQWVRIADASRCSESGPLPADPWLHWQPDAERIKQWLRARCDRSRPPVRLEPKPSSGF
ncbi:MAG: hypothetical protein ACP5O1_10790 [Phycisphaerae bacterium]